jgi:peptidoglycan hydrolase-like protein with peptidoglycan-binding domain
MKIQELSGLSDAVDVAVASYRTGSAAGIKILQARLNQYGAGLVVDGRWGPKTEAALRRSLGQMPKPGGSGGQGGGGRVITAEVVGKDTGKDGIRVGGSWKDFFQSSIAAGLTYLKRADAEKKQREAAAAGVDSTIIQNADGTYSVAPAGMDWKKIALYAAIAGVAVVVIMQFSGNRRGSRSRR